jgi:hypothetical protein
VKRADIVSVKKVLIDLINRLSSCKSAAFASGALAAAAWRYKSARCTIAEIPPEDIVAALNRDVEADPHVSQAIGVSSLGVLPGSILLAI